MNKIKVLIIIFLMGTPLLQAMEPSKIDRILANWNSSIDCLGNKDVVEYKKRAIECAQKYREYLKGKGEFLSDDAIEFLNNQPYVVTHERAALNSGSIPITRANTIFLLDANNKLQFYFNGCFYPQNNKEILRPLLEQHNSIKLGLDGNLWSQELHDLVSSPFFKLIDDEIMNRAKDDKMYKYVGFSPKNHISIHKKTIIQAAAHPKKVWTYANYVVVGIAAVTAVGLSIKQLMKKHKESKEENEQTVQVTA